MNILSSIDQPEQLALCDPLAIRVSGWIYACGKHNDLRSVEVRCHGETIGQTQIFFARTDARRESEIPEGSPIGFTILSYFGDRQSHETLTLELVARFSDDSTIPFATRKVRSIQHDYRSHPYGNILTPDFPHQIRRDNIYSSGPSLSGGDNDCLEMLQRYLGSPPCRVLDVGCGLGWYGSHLLRSGYDWLGVEVNESDCAELARRGLPHRLVDGYALPFKDGSFDAAIVVEVLEHVKQPDTFLKEVRRMAPKVIISVPNIELIAYMHPYLAVPWHLLEGDHKHFFTRWNLRQLLKAHYSHVEVLSYGRAPLKTMEGTPLDFHLLAVAYA